MQFISGLNKLQNYHQQTIATIGSFDGVHLGHQHLIRTLKQKAAEYHKPSMVITFEPLPSEYFSPEHAPTRLTLLREKLLWFKHLHVDYILCLTFNSGLANLSAETFINEVLVKRLNIAHLIVGEDFRFGRKRQGDATLLAQQNSFTCEIVKKIMQKNEWVSSTRIRTALQDNDLDFANQLLGRDYAISGRVIQGQKLARTLGFPTANIDLRGSTPPIQGVFAVEVLGLEPTPLRGVANIGQKPTVNGAKKLLEVHLFNFDQSIYGQHIRVIPRKKIRDEKKFVDLSALSSQISEDIRVAKQFFMTTPRVDGYLIENAFSVTIVA